MNAEAYQRRYDTLRRTVDRRLAAMVRTRSPRDLTDACRYVLAGGGKRVRAVLALLACEAVGGKTAHALGAATALELMHNFTLVHDDVMDNADSRRGRPTVHRRWDLNNALLVGDVLIGLAFKNLLRTPRVPRARGGTHPPAASSGMLFTRALLDVCEGQALDLEYEHRSTVSVRGYFRMIEKKTASLFATAAALGATIGGGTQAEAEALGRYGHFLGRAFQLQDDLLDVVADGKSFGKSIGGDIVEGKKTFLLLTAVRRARGMDRAILDGVLRKPAASPASHRADRHRPGRKASARSTIKAVTDIYRRYGILDEARREIQRNTARANRALALIPDSEARRMLAWLSALLVDRVS